MRRRWVVAACAAVMAGCSSGGQSSAAPTPTVSSTVNNSSVQAQGVRTDLTTVEDRNVTKTAILAPIDSVWRVLPSVFIEVGIDPGTVDQKQHIIANTSFPARHTLGDSRVSRYVDCGSIMGTKTADQSTVTMSFIVQAVADSAETSQLRFQFSGYATMDGAVANRISCVSTGVLEARVAKMVNEELAPRVKH